MPLSEKSTPQKVTAHDAVSAEGVPQRYWFVAVVGRNTERACRERLEKLGYACYVASQEEVHVWANGRKKKVEHVLITARIFVRLTESERLQVVRLPYINYFMTNRAAATNAYGGRPMAHVPDHQMQMLQFMLSHADAPVGFVSQVRLDDHIRVVRGSLKGFEGRITREASGDAYAVAALDGLGCALMKVLPADVEIITETKK